MAMMYNFQQLNSQVNIFPPEEMELLHQASHESLCFNDNYFLSETCFDPLSGPNNNLFFSEDNYTSPLPYLLNPCDDQLEYYYSFEPDLFPQQDLEFFSYHKRPKTYEDNYYSDPKTTFFDRSVSNPSLFQDFTVPEVMVPFCDFPSPPPVYSTSNACTACVKKPAQTAERTLSAQSIAARQRRRKITEKTQELGKLVPGGQKMNTAEMFQAAFKYIKYLQAQVAVLESMGSIEDNNGQEHHTQDLQALVASSLVQEKLYSTEKCLVPTNFIEALANDQEIQSNPPVLKEVKQLIRKCV